MNFTIREIQPRDNQAVERIIRTCLKEFGGDRDEGIWIDL